MSPGTTQATVTMALHRTAVALRGVFLLALAAFPTPSTHVAAQEGHGMEPTATEGRDYRVYGRWGASSSVAEILGASSGAEVLLVGEEHDDMVGHALEADLFESLATMPDERGDGTAGGVVLSLEMFERDVQYVLDEYLDGLISESHFLRSARPWDDYDARYRPLVETAKDLGAPVVAANAPRRYVNRVTREGPGSLDELSDLARSYLPPLPYPGPSERYRDQWNALMAEAMAEAGGGPPPAPDTVDAERSPEAEPPVDTAASADAAPDHSVPTDAIHAQALWDAAMGHAITSALVQYLDALVVHFAGSFHVERGTGIPERIQDYRPGTRVVTVVMTKVDDIDEWSEDDHSDLADFVVLTRAPAEAAHPGGG